MPMVWVRLRWCIGDGGGGGGAISVASSRATRALSSEQGARSRAFLLSNQGSFECLMVVVEVVEEVEDGDGGGDCFGGDDGGMGGDDG